MVWETIDLCVKMEPQGLLKITRSYQAKQLD